MGVCAKVTVHMSSAGTEEPPPGLGGALRMSGLPTQRQLLTWSDIISSIMISLNLFPN